MAILKSHPGTNGCRVMSRPHTDTMGRVWPTGTAYRPLTYGNATVERCDDHGTLKLVTVTKQTICIESPHYQDVITEGFGEVVQFVWTK